MFKFKLKDQSESNDPKSDHSLYQLIFLSVLLYEDVWKFINKDFDSIPLHYRRFDWSRILDIPELDKLTPRELITACKRSNADLNIVRELLLEKYKSLQNADISLPNNLKHNLNLLKSSFELNDAELFVIVFTAYMHRYRVHFCTILNYLYVQNHDQRSPRSILADCLSTMTTCTYEELYKALSPTGKLNQIKIIRMEFSDDYEECDFADCLTFCGQQNERLFAGNQTLESLLATPLTMSPTPTLKTEDFDYLEPKLSLMLNYWEKSVKEGKVGVNYLLYGPPGTGKSELSRIISKSYCANVYEIPVVDEDGDPISDRTDWLVKNLAQVKTQTNSAIIFDEAQDYFDKLTKTEYGEKQCFKGMTNQLLETNKTPIIWITNDIDSIDPAYLRRFDFTLNVEVPPQQQRAKIIAEKSLGKLSPSSVKCLSERNDIAPALISRTTRVLDDINTELFGYDKAFELHINETLRSMHLPPVKMKVRHDNHQVYDPRYCTADANLEAIVDGLKNQTTARLCLYGVPGTGKTAWAKHLGEVLNKKVITKRGSDLLNCFVGGTEANISKAFSEAHRENAILLIDEADSFLQNRTHAHHSWEVTQVNEMLTQIESFEGIFIATTNHLDSMDDACLRRFDLKIQFNYLTSENAWKLFQKHCEVLFPEQPITEALQREVARLTVLTPGDFAVVLRQSRFSKVSSPNELLKALQRECNVKSVCQHRTIGF